jgi:hypothetical protein
VLSAATVQAEEPPAPPNAPTQGCLGDRFVILKLDDGFDPVLGEEVRTDLTTDLAHRGLGLCSLGSTARAPEAIVTLREQAPLGVVIELDDLVTHKRVERDLSVQKIPADGRALAIAIAIDELLRASWAELTLERSWQDEPDDEDTRAETRDLRREPRPARRSGASAKRSVELGAALGYAHTAKSFDALSLHGRAALRPWGFGWSQLDVGALVSRPVDGPFGDAIAFGLATALTLGGCSRVGAPLFGCAGVRGGIDALSVRGVRPNMARARRDQAVVLHASAVALLGTPLTARTHLFGELGLGAVLSGVKATDGTRSIMDISGLLVSLRLGFGVEL